MKKHVKRTIIVGLASMILLLGGCKANSKNTPSKDNGPKSENSTDNTTTTKKEDTMQSPQSSTKELGYSDVTNTNWPETKYSVKEFDLGKREYKLTTGKTMPYQLRGVIGMPEGDGPFPLVLITHGSHENIKKDTRFDTGFEYLVENFAKHGVIAVSMDLGQAYIWSYGDSDDKEKSVYMTNDHLEHLVNASKGETNNYPLDLNGKIDFNKISLIGHSRGGENIIDIAANMSTKGYPVSSLLCIAPTLLQTDHPYTDSNVAILVPEYDGDVLSLDGYTLYDILNKQTKGNHSVTLLKGANHNYFNRDVKPNDATLIYKEEELKDQISREDQENFLKSFALDFILGKFQKSKQDDEFNLSKPQPNTMYGQSVKVLLKNSNAASAIDTSNPNNYSLDNLSASAVIDSWWYQEDDLAVDTVTSGQGDQKTRNLLKVTWNQNPSQIKFKPTVKDLSNYKTLIIDLLVDPADDSNKNITNQQFKVRFTDESGNTATLSLPDKLNALAVPVGTIKTTEIDNKEFKYWSKITPLGSLMLPLESLENVQLDKISSIDLIFDETTSGSILIEDMRLQ